MPDEYKSRKNQWLVVLETVRLTSVIDPVITALDPWFEKANFKARVTSGLRDPFDQLSIVRHYCVLKGIDKEFPRIMTAGVSSKYLFDGMSVFDWQPAWSKLLNIGVIISPPLAAMALFDYVRDGVNKKGQIIGSSPHFKGTAFDIGGGTGKPNVDDELAIVKEAFESHTIPNWSGYLTERQNNCVHNDCSIAVAT